MNSSGWQYSSFWLPLLWVTLFTVSSSCVYDNQTRKIASRAESVRSFSTQKAVVSVLATVFTGQCPPRTSPKIEFSAPSDASIKPPTKTHIFTLVKMVYPSKWSIPQIDLQAAGKQPYRRKHKAEQRFHQQRTDTFFHVLFVPRSPLLIFKCVKMN